MNKIFVKGPSKISGTVHISGSKNAILPILFSSLLATKSVKIYNVPYLEDVKNTIKILKKLGLKVTYKNSIKKYIKIDFFKNIDISSFISYKLFQSIRASIWILSSLIARFGKAKIFLPGGCKIGNRPIDLHINSLEKMGVIFIKKNKIIQAYSKIPLKGSHFILDKISVGTTITIMIAASVAKGKTIIQNSAREPEIVDTANFLNTIGANIIGAGTNIITIIGVKRLKGGTYKIIPDRIETGTYLVASAISKGKIICRDTNPFFLKKVISKLRKSGADIKLGSDWISLDMHGKRPKSVDIYTKPYPGFPTDLQPQFTLLNMIAKGNSKIIENIFENRFMHVFELIKMGAKVKIKNNKTIMCYGTKTLFANIVSATDLRSSVSLLLAGCISKGITIIKNPYYLDRGYENIIKKLNYMGANIIKIKCKKLI